MENLNVNVNIEMKDNKDSFETVIFSVYHVDSDGIEYQGQVKASDEQCHDLGIF